MIWNQVGYKQRIPLAVCAVKTTVPALMANAFGYHGRVPVSGC